MKVKICGITNTPDALLCERLGADVLGFIFYPGSKRYVDAEQVKDICQQLSAYTVRTGVFVNESPEHINSIMRISKLHTAQILADNYQVYQKELDYPFYPCYRVTADFIYDELLNNQTGTLLLDTYSPNAYGGTGKSFDWKGIPAPLMKRTILAGGIAESHLPELFAEYHPYGIDVLSSLEDVPGRKSVDRTVSFFKVLDQIRKK